MVADVLLMRMPLSGAALAAALLLLPASAQAEKLTLGSDLTGAASLVQAQGADTAFWLEDVNSAPFAIPEDGQILAIRVKGSALREKGAATDPATLVHFQTLDPADAGGKRQIYLTSGTFNMPVDDPAKVSEFAPENLCVRKGGSVAFNTIGGFRWGGSLDAPLSNSYTSGTPWQIFARTNSSTNWYSKDEGTKNGMTLDPSAPGPTAAEGIGGTHRGQELLLQIVLATGDDRSEPCGGPRRHPDGTLVDVTPEAMSMNVTKYRGQPQLPYVSARRAFAVGVYCGGQTLPKCEGTAQYGAKVRNKKTGKTRMVWMPAQGTAFSIDALNSARLPFVLAPGIYKKLTAKKIKRFTVQFRMVTPFGTFQQPITLMQ